MKKYLSTAVFHSLLLACVCLEAHQPGNSSLVLSVQNDGGMRGEYHVANVDVVSINLMLEDNLRRVGGADSRLSAANGVNAMPWMEIRSDGNMVTFETFPPETVTTENGPHTMIPFKTGPANPADLQVAFQNFFQFDPQHTVNVELELGDQSKVGLISLENPSWSPVEGAFKQFIVFTIEGIWHIWIGIDHILFLIALLLPSVLRLEKGKWTPVTNFKEAFYNVLKVVTAFTVAHSVTLTLATLDIVTLPSKWVEAVIALSVVLAALNNIVPLVSDRVWAVALGFGFIHGFGFANVLADLDLPTGTLAIALFSFNIGVEIGQLAIVLVFFPIIFLLRSQAFYQPIKLRLGSAVIASIACAWIIDRVFELDFMPF
jgi:hypothetical protein